MQRPQLTLAEPMVQRHMRDLARQLQYQHGHQECSKAATMLATAPALRCKRLHAHSLTTPLVQVHHLVHLSVAVYSTPC